MTAKPTFTDCGLMSLTDAAEYLGVTARTVRRFIADGELAAYRVGSRMIRLKRDDVMNLARPIPTTQASKP